MATACGAAHYYSHCASGLCGLCLFTQVPCIPPHSCSTAPEHPRSPDLPPLSRSKQLLLQHRAVMPDKTPVALLNEYCAVSVKGYYCCMSCLFGHSLPSF